MSDQDLLTQVSRIAQKYDMHYRTTGGHFNIFEVTNIAHDEVTVCRVIYELLNPKGAHCQGDVYLRLFWSNVLHIPLDEQEISSVKVHREYCIDSQRRIDLVIETKSYFIPIEVKIYAEDQPKQCADYYAYAQNSKHSQNPKIYYLTRFGTPPSAESADGLTPKGESYKEVVELSFADDILSWLNLCMQEPNTIKITPIREVLRQFAAVIRKFTDQMENEEQMEIKELLMNDPDNLKSAIAIKNTVDEAREDLIIRLFDVIDKKVGRTRLRNGYDYADRNYEKVRAYYQRKGNTWPGISYLYRDKDSIQRDRDIWVRLELENDLFVGYCCPKDEKSYLGTLSNEDISKILRVEPNPSQWWAYTRDMIEEKSGQNPDFKNHNDSYYKLLDQAVFESFTEYCAKQIVELLDRKP